MAGGGRRVSVRVLVQVTELAADDIGQRMRQGVEDHGGLQVAGPRGLEVAAAEQDVTQPGQRVALAERRADLAVGIDGLLVVGLGPGEITQVQVDEADAVQGVGRAAAVTRFPVQAQRPLAVGSARPRTGPGERRASRRRSPAWPASTSARRP